MGTDHRGNPTGTNHRPTPRLAQLIARQSNALYRITPEKAQTMLNDYRRLRDGLGSGVWAESPKLDQLSNDRDQTASAINRFIADRSK